MSHTNHAQTVSKIDHMLWPTLEPDETDHDEWMEDLTPEARQEYAEAMDDIHTAYLTEEGFLKTQSRTFSFCRDLPQFGTQITRIDWVSPSGETFAIGCYTDERLQNLARDFPLEGAVEMARRFGAALTHPCEEDQDIGPIQRAIAIRNFLEDDSSIIAVEPWTGRYLIEDSDENVQAQTEHLASKQFSLASYQIQGPKTDHSLCIEGMVLANRLGDDPLDGMSPDLIQRLSKEVNIILGKYGITSIEPDSWDDVLSDQDGFKFADEMTSESPESITDWPLHIDEAYHIVHDDSETSFVQGILAMAAATGLHDNEMITPSGTAKLIPTGNKEFPPSIVLPDQSMEIDFHPILAGDSFDSNTATISFFKNLPAKIPGVGLPVAISKTTSQMMALVSRAVAELFLSQHAKHDGPEHFGLCIIVTNDRDGQIVISIDHEPIYTGTNVQPIVLLENGHLSFPHSQFLLSSEAPVCLLVAERLQQSAQNVLDRFDIPLELVSAAIINILETMEDHQTAESNTMPSLPTKIYNQSAIHHPNHYSDDDEIHF